MQTKKQSFIESLTNVAIGYLISLLSLFIIFPILGIESSTGKNLIITLYFTLITLYGSYSCVGLTFHSKGIRFKADLQHSSTHT